MKWESKNIDWSDIFEKVVNVREDNITCFKIIPDKSITNYNNYKFFKDMAELEKVNNLADNVNNLFNIIRKKENNGFKVTYQKATDIIWYEIVIREGNISFYVLCYERNADFVRLKLEQVFPHAPIEEVDEEETWLPEEDTMIADLKLQRHNFFSIHVDRKEQAQPIEDILNCAEDVKEDDVLKFSLRVQPYDRNYWSYKCEEWEKKARNGRTPKRVRLSKAGVINGAFSISEFAFQKLSELFREIHNVAFKKFKTKQVVTDHGDVEAREIGEFTRSTTYKMNAPVFKSTMRVASHSPNEVRRIMNLKSLTASFVDLKDSNNSIVRTGIHSKTEDSKILDWRWNQVFNEVCKHKMPITSNIDIDFNILCDKELGKLNMLPTSAVQKKLSGKMESLGRTESAFPAEYLEEDGIFVGYGEYKGEKQKIYVPDKDEDESVLPILSSGIQGVGKDTFGINWVYENNKKGKGAIVLDIIDEKDRGMTDVFKTIIKPENLIVLDFANLEYTPYLDWAEGMKSENRFTQNRLATELIKFFECDDDGAGLQTERYLRNCVKAMPRASLIEMGMILVSDSIRERAIKECEDRGDISTANFWKMFEEEGDGRKKQIASPIFNRLSKLLDDPALKPIFGQKPNGTIDFDKWLSEGKVVVCRMPKVAFGTSGIQTLGQWLIIKTWLTKQVQLQEGRKCQSILLINEPHQIMSKGLEAIFKEIYPEARKTGLQLVTMYHEIVQIPKDLFDIMLSSGANFVVYKQRTDKAWSRFKDRITDTFSIEECMKIPKHEAVLGFLANKRDLPAVRVLMNDMPHKRGEPEYDNEKRVQECLEQFHRPIEEVEKETLGYEMELMNSGKKKSAKKTTKK
ncbi:ATPase domain protein [Bacillus phage YungSlug]|nr:ATPase domain protein [Bacillus phage YungSlug]